MDEKDKKIKELEETNASLQKSVEELKGLVTKLTESVAEKDKIIETKNGDIVGARKQYKKLSEMTEAEKEALSTKEIELQQRQEALEAEQEAFRKEQQEIRQKEVNARWDQAIKKRVGENAEHAEQLRNHMKSFVDHDKAITEEEISSLADKGLNLFGDAKPNPINQAINANGNAPDGGNGSGFADTEAGKGLAKSLNLDIGESAS